MTSHMNAPTSVRRAGVGDAAALADIADQAYAGYLPRMPKGVRPAPMDADYGAAIEDDEVWVSAAGTSLTGFVILVRAADHLLLENIAVHPQFQSGGVGRLLIALAEERALACGLASIELYTNAVMTENQRLYERLGYVEAGRRRDGAFDRVMYRKALG